MTTQRLAVHIAFIFSLGMGACSVSKEAEPVVSPTPDAIRPIAAQVCIAYLDEMVGQGVITQTALPDAQNTCTNMLTDAARGGSVQGTEFDSSTQEVIDRSTVTAMGINGQLGIWAEHNQALAKRIAAASFPR